MVDARPILDHGEGREDVLYLGSSSWKFPSWRGLVYSKTTPPSRFLSEYTSRFSCVEVDQWFWSLFSPDQPPVLPKPETASEYAASVPPHFRFGIKLPDALTLTHYRPKAAETALRPNPHFLSTELLAAFMERIAPLNPFLGPMMLQFGYLNRQMTDSQTAFHNHLARFFDTAPRHFPWAVECRNPTWHNAAYLEFLKERKVGLVVLRGYYMPPFFDWLRQNLDRLPDSVILRLQAGDRSDMERRTGGRWSRRIEPKDAELEATAEIIGRLRDKGRSVWVFVNNHYEGSAPLTLARLQERLNGA